MNSISVVIPVYNGADYIDETVRSCLSQTRHFDEIVIVDDASSDDTYDIAQHAIAEHSSATLHRLDSRVPAPSAWNAAVSFSAGDFVIICAHDDVLDADFCLRAREIMAGHADVDMIVLPYRTIDSAGHVLESFAGKLAEGAFQGVVSGGACVSEFCLNGQFFLPGGVVMRRKLFDRLGGFDSRLSVAYDWGFLLRACAYSEMIFFDDQPRWSYRLHPAQSIKRHIAQDNGDSDTAFMTLHQWAPFLDDQQRRDIVLGMQDFNENILSAQIRDKTISSREVVVLRKAIGAKMRRWREADLPQSVYVRGYPRKWARMLVWLLSSSKVGVEALRWGLTQQARATYAADS